MENVAHSYSCVFSTWSLEAPSLGVKFDSKNVESASYDTRLDRESGANHDLTLFVREDRVTGARRSHEACSR